MKIAKYMLVVFNIMAALMHILFQYYLYESSDLGNLHSFLLVENILMAGAFILFGVALVYNKFSINALLQNSLFWIFFFLAILIIRPKHTTLDLFHLSIPQWVILSIIGAVASVLNVLYYIHIIKVHAQQSVY